MTGIFKNFIQFFSLTFLKAYTSHSSIYLYKHICSFPFFFSSFFQIFYFFKICYHKINIFISNQIHVLIFHRSQYQHHNIIMKFFYFKRFVTCCNCKILDPFFYKSITNFKHPMSISICFYNCYYFVFCHNFFYLINIAIQIIYIYFCPASHFSIHLLNLSFYFNYTSTLSFSSYPFTVLPELFITSLTLGSFLPFFIM